MPRGGLHGDEPSVVLDDAVDDGESEPGAMIFRGEERFENPVLDVRRNSVARILYPDGDEQTGLNR